MRSLNTNPGTGVKAAASGVISAVSAAAAAAAAADGTVSPCWWG